MDFSLADDQLTTSGIFLYSSYNGNLSLQTSVSTLSPGGFQRGDRNGLSCDAIWLWIAIIATVGNIVVVGVVCACTF